MKTLAGVTVYLVVAVAIATLVGKILKARREGDEW